MNIFDRLTPRQQDAASRIAVGLDSGINPRTAAALVKRGIIVDYTEEWESGIPGVRMTVTRYLMPIPTHMAWCAWCAEEDWGSE